jgi:hypothetical protein
MANTSCRRQMKPLRWKEPCCCLITWIETLLRTRLALHRCAFARCPAKPIALGSLRPARHR